MSATFDFVLSVGAIVVGLMLLTGHGNIFMKGGDPVKRKKLYDEKKMEKSSGAALLAIGILTGIDHFTTSMEAKLAYLAAMIIVVVIWIVYLKKKCMK